MRFVKSKVVFLILQFASSCAVLSILGSKSETTESRQAIELF